MITTLPAIDDNPFGWPPGVRFARPPVTAHDLVAFVANSIGVPPAQLIGACRERDLVRGRWAVMVALSERGWSLPRIGAALGGRDHTTVMNGIDRARELATEDRAFAQLLAAVVERAGA